MSFSEDKLTFNIIKNTNKKMEELKTYLENVIISKNQQLEEDFCPEVWDMDSKIEWERLEESVFELEDLLNKIKSDFFTV